VGWVEGSSSLATIDIAIIVGFLVLVTGIGIALSKRAAGGLDDYFLGGNKIPWWILGASTATSNFDMSGTMIIVAVIFALGFEGFFVEMRGGVGLCLAFLMVFLGKWLRRSEVMTSAEWMKVRFGTDRQGRTAHLLSAVANIVLSLGMIIYFAKGAGKFLTHFIPLPELWCTALMVGIGLAYTLMSGLYGVVFTDLVQMILLVFTAIYVSVEAFALRPEVVLPEGFLEIDFVIEQGKGASLLAKDPAGWSSIFQMFGLCVVMWLFKVTLEGAGGVGGYTDQRFFAARSEREASLLTFESIILSIFRWTMVAGLVVMGYHLVQTGAEGAAAIKEDAEQVLPIVLSKMLPAGVRGLVVAGLIAAAMSTFDSTLNAGASYIVKDVYESYIRPEATQKQLMNVSRWATVGLCVAGIGLAAVVPNINTIWGLITMGLGAGLAVPLFLRWYWPRFTGYGFAAGTAGGLVAGISFNTLLQVPLYISFPATVALALACSVVVTYVTPAASEEVLVEFWRRIRPWGFWSAIAGKAEAGGVVDAAELATRKKERRQDYTALAFAIPFQICVLLGAMSFIFHAWEQLAVFGGISLLTGMGLYRFWFKALPTSSPEATDLEDELALPEPAE